MNSGDHLMNTPMPTSGDLYLVVGYDGSEPATRALDGAIRLLRGREGSIDVVYVPHLPSVDMMSPGAVAGMEDALDEISVDLQKQATEQMRGGREERWRFVRVPDMITDIPEALTKVARKLTEEHPDDNVVIVVGSSSQARHRLVGSVAVSLARHAPVPLIIVP
jgi:nucleotide-binding universal stress UspA family protein